MLSKLFKYEFRATGRTFLPAYAVLLVMSFFTRLYYSGSLRGAMVGSMTETWITVVVSMVMVMLFTAVWVVTLVVVVRRFWTNILGREGYLTNVLPVAPWEHVCSKAVVSMVWVILSAIVSAAALVIMLGDVLNWTGSNLDWANLARAWNDGWTWLRAENAAAQAVWLLVLGVLNSLFAVLGFVLTAYAAMCVGQLANRRRVWASIGAYFGISIAHSVLGSMLFADRGYGQLLWSLGVLSGDGPTGYRFRGAYLNAHDFLAAVNTELLIYLAFTLAVCAVLFWLSQRLLKKRLNLQ